MTFRRRRVFTNSPYEKKFGVCRAVRAGSFVTVSGTAPLGPDGNTVGKGDPAAQARSCFEIIRVALEELGGELSDVVRTRILLTRIQDWEAVAKVHGEVFQRVRPATTVMQVGAFIDPHWLIEVEADALIRDDDQGKNE
jgi:enamine deaminase RidA (YjgF/YER057c/UK114 family)